MSQKPLCLVLLSRLGHDVLVLEGRDRVGGRSYTATLAGAPVDLGATFVGPTQKAHIIVAVGPLNARGCPLKRSEARRLWSENVALRIFRAR